MYLLLHQALPILDNSKSCCILPYVLEEQSMNYIKSCLIIAMLLGAGDECWMYFGYEGDVNLDYEINILDVVMLTSHILEPNLEGCSLETADINEDEELNILDIIAIVNIILGI